MSKNGAFSVTEDFRKQAAKHVGDPVGHRTYYRSYVFIFVTKRETEPDQLRRLSSAKAAIDEMGDNGERFSLAKVPLGKSGQKVLVYVKAGFGGRALERIAGEKKSL